MELIVQLKNKIKELRSKKNLTQIDLAKLVGVRRETILFLEKNKYNPSLQLAVKISRVFETTVENVFLFEPDEDDT